MEIVMRLLILSCISGVLSYLSVSLPRFLAPHFDISDDILFFLPGVLFGAFILMPLVKATTYTGLRRIGLLGFSVLAWYTAASVGIQVLPLVHQASILSGGISGVIGVLFLAAASRYLIPFKFDGSSILLALLAGFLGGCVIGLAIRQPRTSVSGEACYFLGFLLWHCSVAMSLFGRLKAPAKSSREHPAR